MHDASAASTAFDWSNLLATSIGALAAIAGSVITQQWISNREITAKSEREARVQALFQSHVDGTLELLKMQVETGALWDIDMIERAVKPLRLLHDDPSTVLQLRPRLIRAIGAALSIVDLNCRTAHLEISRANHRQNRETSGERKAQIDDQLRESLKSIFEPSYRDFKATKAVMREL